MNKADVALSSAKALFARGDVDGAVNRAYYAMFDPARAALIVSGDPTRQDPGRTHSGLISEFGLCLVKPGFVEKELGRMLNRAHEIRQVADYTDESVALTDAERMLLDAEIFIGALRSLFFSVD
jgi:uncharacterized protein (UPF0332 family)